MERLVTAYQEDLLSLEELRRPDAGLRRREQGRPRNCASIAEPRRRSSTCHPAPG